MPLDKYQFGASNNTQWGNSTDNSEQWWGELITITGIIRNLVFKSRVFAQTFVNRTFNRVFSDRVFNFSFKRRDK